MHKSETSFFFSQIYLIISVYNGKKVVYMEKIIFGIDGMNCASCSARIESVLNKLNGIESAEVNLVSEKATVVYNPDIIRFSTISSRINAMGFKTIDSSQYTPEEKKLKKMQEFKSLIQNLIIALIFSIPLFIITLGTALQLPIFNFLIFNPITNATIQFCLTIPVLFAGYQIFMKGYKALFSLSPNMDSLVAIGTTASFFYSCISTVFIFLGHTNQTLYFSSSGMIITFILIGRALESISKAQTSKALDSLTNMIPSNAIIIDNEGNEKKIPLSDILVGDTIVVKPGESVPADGIIKSGITAINESMLTGEFVPADKIPGDKVSAGTVNITGQIVIRVEKIGKDTAFSKIIAIVCDAQTKKAPISRLADKIAGIFVPVVMCIALLTALLWIIFSRNIELSIKAFVSVLVIACPCALGLATPTAIIVGTGRAAKAGILIKNGEILENVCKAEMVILDKTGTLTEGKATIGGIFASPEYTETDVIQYALTCEQGSLHPLANAIISYAEANGITAKYAETIEEKTGLGLSAQSSGKEILCGNEKLMASHGIDVSAFSRHKNENNTKIYVAANKILIGLITLSDIIKTESIEAVKMLKKSGVTLMVMTGDSKGAGLEIAEKINVDNVLSELLPEEKASEINKLKELGLKTIMVGDGINDAPALAVADIGIALGAGTAAAMETADIVLLKNDLRDVNKAISLSKATMKIIKQNLFWAFAYNIIGIPIAAGILTVFGGPMLNPIISAACMSLSSIFVITNALRLKKIEYTKFNL